VRSLKTSVLESDGDRVEEVRVVLSSFGLAALTGEVNLGRDAGGDGSTHSDTTWIQNRAEVEN
jgi:hypothetical protein